MSSSIGRCTQLHQVVGVDEVGRGPLAGPVTAAAVVLDPARPIAGLADSKTLSEKRRVRLAHEIRGRALACSVAHVDVATIDAVNILQATMLAMQRAVAGIAVPLQLALIDGNRAPALACPSYTLIKGDARNAQIAAASILAKVSRDALLAELALRFPGYGLERHKGYGTAEHREALLALGPSPIHRLSFAPVRDSLANADLTWAPDALHSAGASRRPSGRRTGRLIDRPQRERP